MTADRLHWSEGRAVTFLPPVTAAATTLPVKAHHFGSTPGENEPPLTGRGDCQVAHLIPLTRFRASPFLIGKMPMPRLLDLDLRAGRHSRVWRGNHAPNPGNHQSSNLMPLISAHAVATKTPFGAWTSTVADPALVSPVASTVVSPAMIVQPVKTF